ncbi:MAG: molybdenum cofactor guanylyltransferase [Natronospirillum sp.]
MIGQPVDSQTVGVVLAGGQSRRMRVDKATLRWRTTDGDTITWLEHSQRRLQSVCTSVAVSGPALDALPDQYADHQGPLAGIATALAHFPNQRCVFLPVDMPWVTPAALNNLCRLSTAHGLFQTSLFPILLTADAEAQQCVQQLLTHPERSQRSLRSLFSQLPAATVTQLTADDPKRMRNVNHPADLGTELFTLNHSLLEHVHS